MSIENKVIPITQVRPGELACDACMADASRLYRVRVRQGIELVLCAEHVQARLRLHPDEEVIAIHEVICIAPVVPVNRPVMLARHVPLEFELKHVTLKNITPAQLNEACEAVENRPEFSKLTIIPPDAGGVKFTVEVEDPGLVAIDIPSLQKALRDALEAIA